MCTAIRISYVLEFSRVRDDLYQCTQCKRFRKTRSIKIVNDKVVLGNQHPRMDTTRHVSRYMNQIRKKPCMAKAIQPCHACQPFYSVT